LTKVVPHTYEIPPSGMAEEMVMGKETKRRTRHRRDASPRGNYEETMHVKITPGQFIRRAREVRLISQAELARRSRIRQPTLSAIEHGRVAVGLERAKRIAAVLGLHPMTIVEPQWHYKYAS
jgi:ribosome-binding protein aMBF1 (putative translation factor)